MEELETSTARKYRLLDFVEGRAFVRLLGLPSPEAYEAVVRIAGKVAPNSPFGRLPLRPAISYKEFTDWRDFLGPSYLGSRGQRSLPYEEAKLVLHPLGLADEKAYLAYLDRTGRVDLPRNPRKVYGSAEHGRAWGGWEDYLGPAAAGVTSRATGETLRVLPYARARGLSRPLGIRGPSEYARLDAEGRLPKGLPARPDRVYGSPAHGDVWSRSGGWADFLGDSYQHGQSFRSVKAEPSYDEARDVVAPYGLRSGREYARERRAGRLPATLPSNPEGYYKRRGSWRGWAHFLALPDDKTLRVHGETTGRAPILPFEEARAALRELRVRSKKHYLELARAGELPPGLPLRPEIVYLRADQGAHWRGWPHYLSSQRAHEV